MIEIKNLSFSYGKKKAQLFNDFSLNIDKGSIIGLLGKNGTGKSTLLYLMTGLLRPQQGEIIYDGLNVAGRRPSTLSSIYLLPEEYNLPKISLKQYIAVNAPFYPNFSREQLMSNLTVFEMGDENMNIGELSMGQKKKVLISFALAVNTPLLIMDEPTNGLDIPSKSQFRKVLTSSMSDDRTVIISTHQVRDISQLLDRIVIVDRAKLLLDESVARICDKLCFEELPASEPCADAIYASPSPMGNSTIRLNGGGIDTNLNLELLFNAMLEKSDEISAIFNEKH